MFCWPIETVYDLIVIWLCFNVVWFCIIQNGKFWIFDITSHSLQIFNIGNVFVDIKGTEFYFQLSGAGNAVLTIGAKTAIKPAGPIERLVENFLEGFLESMVGRLWIIVSGMVCLHMIVQYYFSSD